MRPFSPGRVSPGCVSPGCGTRFPRAHQGFGVIFFIALAIIIILVVMIGGNQVMTVSGQVRDAAAAIELGRKAVLVVESSIDEAVFNAVAGVFNSPGGELFAKMRQFTDAGDPQIAQGIEPVFQETTPFITKEAFPPRETFAMYTEDEDLALQQKDPERAPVHFGVIRRDGFERNSDGSNENWGLLNFTHAATVQASGVYRNIDRTAELTKSFKIVMLGPPWPFSKYALFVRHDPSLPKPGDHNESTNPLSRWLLYQRSHDFFARTAKAWNDYATANSLPTVQLPAFPLSDPLTEPGPVVCDTAPVSESDSTRVEIKPEDFAMPQLAQFYDPNGATSSATDIAAAGGATLLSGRIELVKAELARATGKLRSLSTQEKDDWFGPGKGGYDALSPECWQNKATKKCKDIADLRLATQGEDGSDTLYINGVYYVEQSITLNHPFEGQGVIFCRGDGGDGVKIVKLQKRSASSSITVISNKDIDLTGLLGVQVDANLMAPKGTVHGYRGKTINGSLMVQHLSLPAGWYRDTDATVQNGPALKVLKSQVDYRPWTAASSSYQPDQYSMLRVYLEPGYVRKRYFARREYQR